MLAKSIFRVPQCFIVKVEFDASKKDTRNVLGENYPTRRKNYPTNRQGSQINPGGKCTLVTFDVLSFDQGKKQLLLLKKSKEREENVTDRQMKRAHCSYSRIILSSWSDNSILLAG